MFKKNIILVGFMGAGKSTVAVELVRYGNYRLLDLDAEIERRRGLSIREIFCQHSESFFRDLETTSLANLRCQNGLVVATGGGIVCRAENRELLRSIGFVVYLRVTFSELKKRLKFSTDRPLINEKPDWSALEVLFQSRSAFYEMADFIVDTDNKEPKVVAHEILQRLGESLDDR
jgi:shikimate kinase